MTVAAVSVIPSAEPMQVMPSNSGSSPSKPAYGPSTMVTVSQ